MANRKVITGMMVTKWAGILGVIAFAASWVIVSVREGALIPEFIREDWWMIPVVFMPVFLITAVEKKDENPQ